MYIIDQIEHGNGGVMDTKVLGKMPLGQLLKKTPKDFGVYTKVFGFWPVLCRGKDANKPSYYWDEDEWCWKKCSRKDNK